MAIPSASGFHSRGSLEVLLVQSIFRTFQKFPTDGQVFGNLSSPPTPTPHCCPKFFIFPSPSITKNLIFHFFAMVSIERNLRSISSAEMLKKLFHYHCTYLMEFSHLKLPKSGNFYISLFRCGLRKLLILIRGLSELTVIYRPLFTIIDFPEGQMELIIRLLDNF